MDYSLTKLLPLLVFPLGLALLFNLAGLVAFGLGKRKTGGMISFSAITYLWLASSPQIADWMMSGLEQDYPRTPSSKLESVEAIVMLGGGVERLIHTARLYNQGKAPVVYASGGGARLSEPEALTLMNLLIAMGLPEEVIVRESSSRNTYENAKNTSRLLAENNIQRILLVTSAFHMRRATAVFEQFGVSAIPAATDYQVNAKPKGISRWVPDVMALGRTTLAFKEYLAWYVYKVRGWVS